MASKVDRAKTRKHVVTETKRTCFKKEEGLSYVNIAEKDAQMCQCGAPQ